MVQNCYKFSKLTGLDSQTRISPYLMTRFSLQRLNLKIFIRGGESE